MAAEAATAAVVVVAEPLSRVSDGVASSRLSSLSRLELEAELAAATEAHRLARDEQLEFERECLEMARAKREATALAQDSAMGATKKVGESDRQPEKGSQELKPQDEEDMKETGDERFESSGDTPRADD